MNKEKVFLTIVILASIILSAICIHNGHEWGDDFALYIEQAKAINHHSLPTLYQQNRFLLDNSDTIISPYLYPNGFPLLLSIVYCFYGLNFIVMKCFCALFFIVSLPIIYKLFSTKFERKIYPLLIVTAIALHGVFLTFSDNIVSDLPFFLGCLLSLLLIEQPRNITSRIILGLVIFFTYSIRDTGLFLLVALMVYDIRLMVFNKKTVKEIMAYSMPYLLFGLGYYFNKTLFFRDSSNLYQLFKPISISVIVNGMDYYLSLITGYFFIAVLVPFVKIPLMLMIVGGMIYRLKKDAHLIVFALLSLGVYFIWPTSQGIRYIFPVIPFCVYFLAQCFIWMSNQKREKVLYVIFAFMVLTMVMRGVNYSLRFSRTETNEAKTAEMDKIYQYINNNIPQNQIIAFFKPRALRLFTNRNGIVINDTALMQSKADYVLKSDLQLQGNKQFTLLYNTDKYYLYKINRAAMILSK